MEDIREEKTILAEHEEDGMMILSSISPEEGDDGEES